MIFAIEASGWGELGSDSLFDGLTVRCARWNLTWGVPILVSLG
jgi:hypothetical protein